MYSKYATDYTKLEREYEKLREEEEKNRSKGSSNKFMTHITTLKKDILKIDRKLLEESAKTVRGINKFVDPSSVLMVRKEKKENNEVCFL